MSYKITAYKQIADSKLIIETILNLDVHPAMKRKVIDTMIWNITGASGKYNLSYKSIKAIDNNREVQHEHVFRKKLMIDKILEKPDNYNEILNSAISCLVTKDEHKLLSKIDKENPEIDGWERYKIAKIKVFDIKNNEMLEI